MDIISSLPDPILCHILSFLPIKSSLATSVLARRWRFLWTSVRNLYFEEKYCGSGLVTGFADMVDRVLLLHDGPIDSLSILPYEDTMITQNQFDAWISTAIARNVQVLYLSAHSEIRPPQCCFKWKTLVELTIECCTIYAKPDTVCLPKLKKLNLLSNYYADGESLTNLVSGCLAIENLVIENEWDEWETVCCCLCSPTLKSLVLKFSVTCDELDHEQKLVLDIPAVQYLRIDYDISYIIWAEKLSSLVVADICLSDDFFDDFFYSEDEENISRWRGAFQFLEKLSNAKSLTLRSSAFRELLNPIFSIATTAFHNLTQLKLEAHWHILTELLESAYKLESLTIEKVERELKCWREPTHLPKCLLSSLKYVYIFGFAGGPGDDEFDMVRYILRHAKVLKRIKIYLESYGKGSKREMRQEIRVFHEDLKNVGLLLFENCKLAAMNMILNIEFMF